MVDQGLVRYIRERRGEGYHEDHIRKALHEHGHDQSTVDDAFHHVHRQEPVKPILPILIILLIGLGVLLFFLFRPDGTVEPLPVINETPQPGPASGNVVEIAAQLKVDSVNQTPDEIYLSTVLASTAHAGSVADGILLCSINEELTYKNYCLQEMAETRRDPEYCEVIGNAGQRDDCYLGLILAGEDQYCGQLLLEENQRVCEILLGERYDG